MSISSTFKVNENCNSQFYNFLLLDVAATTLCCWECHTYLGYNVTWLLVCVLGTFGLSRCRSWGQDGML